MHRLLSFLDFKYTLRITISLIFVVLSLILCYWGWELYWWLHVGYPFLKWHTHLMPYITIGFFELLLFRVLYRLNPSERLQTGFLIFNSVLFALFAGELFFAISGRNYTYMEQVSGAYMSPYEALDKTYYHVWPHPNEPHLIKKPEYSHWHPTNSLGFPDDEWSTDKPKSQKRILALGDSFTEGDGAPTDSSYVRLMKKYLLAKSDSFYVMNGGVCGDDPFYNYISLKDQLLKYKPDVIIQSWGTGDMTTDILLRGGMERFQKNGTVKYKSPPAWEPIYAMSYISRVFLKTIWGYNELLRNNNVSQAQADTVNKEVMELLPQYLSLCRQNHIKLIIVLHPQKGEVIDNKYDYDFAPMLRYLATQRDVTVIDLLPLYKAYIDIHHTSVDNYYWVYDGHHNPTGYNMMAQTTLAAMMPILTDSISR